MWQPITKEEKYMKTKDKKTKVFYRENEAEITFYSTTCDFSLTLYKTAENFKQFQQVINSNKYEFIDLLKG